MVDRFTTQKNQEFYLNQKSPSSRLPQHKMSGTGDDKHKEFLRQQQRLRLMSASVNKTQVTADKLIETLIQKKETFIPQTNSPSTANMQGTSSFNHSKMVHQMFAVPAVNFYNPENPQGGHPCLPDNSINDKTNMHIDSNLQSVNFPKRVENDFTDDFSDFQSAIEVEFKNTSIEPKSRSIETNKNYVPCQKSQSFMTSETQKFPDVFVLTSNSLSRGIGSRLANHSRGMPKLSKSCLQQFQNQQSVSVTQTSEDEFSDFQQACPTNTLDIIDSKKIFKKCIKKPPETSYILKETIIRAEAEKGNQGPVELVPAVCESHKNVGNLNPQAGGFDKEKSVESHDKLPVNAIQENTELMFIEEDKYSALRALSLNIPQDTNSIQAGKEMGDSVDDFGDYLSADTFCDSNSLTNTNDDVDLFSLNLCEMPKTSLHHDMISNDCRNKEKYANFHSCETVSLTADTKGSDLLTQFGKLELSAPLSASLEFTYESINDVQTLTGKNYDSIFSHSVDRKFDQLFNKDDKINFRKADITTEEIHTEKHSEGMNQGVSYLEDEEFGEFSGREVWKDEGSSGNGKEYVFGLNVKDIAYDCQSVTSLELPVPGSNHFEALSNLDLPCHLDKNPLQLSDYPDQEMAHVKEWSSCLTSCFKLLQAANLIFNSILNEEVLMEVLNTHEGRDYLYNLREVFGIYLRIRHSIKMTGRNLKNMEILAQIDQEWANLQTYYLKADVVATIEFPFTPNGNKSKDDYQACGICLTSINTELEHVGNACQLEYGGQVYHSVCANLWVNCVDSSLPLLTSRTSLL